MRLAERIQANRFGKAHLTRANALREDYVELIADPLATAGEARYLVLRFHGTNRLVRVDRLNRSSRDSRWSWLGGAA